MNYSDGKRDGFFILYKQGDKVYPCAITPEKLELVGLLLDDVTIVQDLAIQIETYKVEPNKSKVN